MLKPIAQWRVAQTSKEYSKENFGLHMASAEREPIMEVWGRSPQRGPGAEPLARGSGDEAP